MMQDVYQIEAFRIPLHVELTELMEMKVTLKMDCAKSTKPCQTPMVTRYVP